MNPLTSFDSVRLATLQAAILQRHGIPGPWEPLPSTGEANHIYAARDVILRVATDHPEAVRDARTESVAAPVAHAAGVLTPRMLAFDDSRQIVDRPYSLWERVHGETLGLRSPDPRALPDTWRQVGRQIAFLHRQVTCCPDPQGYLDTLTREMGLDGLLGRLVDAGRVDCRTARQVEQLIRDLRPHVEQPVPKRFLHGDLHAMNIMCTREGTLLAIIDWGDAGWADPTLEFAMVPLEAIPFTLEGYESEAPGQLGPAPRLRIAWDKLFCAMEASLEDPARPLCLGRIGALLDPSAE